MIKILDIDNIKIVGKNNQRRMLRIGNHNRIGNTKEYTDFKNMIGMFANKNIKYSKGDKLYFKFHMYNDIDSPLSCILDALEKVGILENDREITNMEIEKVPLKRGSLGRIEIYLQEKRKFEFIKKSIELLTRNI